MDKWASRNKLSCKGIQVQRGRSWGQLGQTKRISADIVAAVGLYLHQYADTVSALASCATMQTRDSTWPLQPSSLSA